MFLRIPTLIFLTLYLYGCISLGTRTSNKLLGGYKLSVTYVTQIDLFLASDESYPGERKVLKSASRRMSKCATRLLAPATDGLRLPKGSELRVTHAKSSKAIAFMVGTGEYLQIFGRTNVIGFPTEIDVTDLSVRNGCEDNGLDINLYSPDPAILRPKK